jgi:N-acetylmuramoyl-L-alanine amidase CwlA
MIRNDMRMAHFHLENWRYELHCDWAGRNCPDGMNFQLEIGDFAKVDSSENGNSYYTSVFREINILSYL